MNIFSLTSAQQRLWIEWKINPISPAYNLNLVFKLTGNLRIGCLKEALSLIIKKHEAFRTYFIEENGEPFQVILSPQDKIFDATPVHWLDISSFSTQEQIKESINHEIRKPFDLKIPLLYRFCLIKASTNVYYFVATIHHIISDGVSLELFINELAKLYNNQVTHQKYLNSTENTLSQYMEYARAKSTLEKQSVAIEYWKNLMTGVEPFLNFHSVAKPANKKSSRAQFIVKPDLLVSLQRLASTHNTTVFIVLMTVFNILLFRYFNSKSLVVGYAVNIRPKELRNLFGFYVNNIPLKTLIEDNQTFSELLELTNQRRKNDRLHQELSLQEIVRTNRSKSDVDKLAPFNVSFNQVSFPTLGLYSQKQGLHLNDLEVEPISIDIGESHFDLSFLYAHVDEQLGFSIDYKVDIFESWFVEQMASHFLTILKSISEDSNQVISRISLLTQEEQNEVFCKLSGPQITYLQDKIPTQLFEANAILFPDKPAIIHNERSISYRALNEKANQLAQFLLKQNVSPTTLIAVGLERGIDYIISIIGIMKARCAYVPIDPKYPDERIKFILKDSNAKIFIVRDDVSEKCSEYSGTFFNIQQDWHKLLELPSTNPKLSYNIQDIAYTIFTSGSTGVPKGVQISVDSLLNLMFWHKTTYLVQSDCEASVVAGAGFDASVWEIWPYLANGATLHIADTEIILDTEKLINWLKKEKINISFLPTPVTDVFLKKAKHYALPDLHFVLTGGEQLKTFPPEGLSFKVFNHYGPTENTVVTTQAEVLPVSSKIKNANTPSIGKPIANVQLYVLDNNRQAVPSGVVGELYIGGVGLAQGYLHQPSLSAQRFIFNPFNPKASKTLYSTGDLVRWELNGELSFIGRVDEQIKLRGFRIELPEIETQLLKYTLIEQCAVLMRTETTETGCLIAYFVKKPNVGQVDINKIQEYLSKFLPDYMIPSLYVSIEKMPLTLNGKVDKKALLALNIKHLDSQGNVSPRTETEKKLLQIWSKVLNMKNIGIHDNFFSLGGHSLLISAVILSVKKSFSVELPFRSFFQKPTIANLAHLIDAASGPITTETKTINDDTLVLRKTIILDEDIKVTTNPTPKDRLQNLLITGATGFLGAFLLADLYSATEAKIYCLIRGASLEEAQKRLEENLTKYNINKKILNSNRIQVLLGDLTKPQMGLSQLIYNILLEKIDSIYHCGAQVHHIYGYDMLEAANVFSTIEIIKLAALKKHKHIHYVSAVSAARQNLDQNGFIIEDFLKPDPGQINIIDGYNQTKLVSELLLTTAKERGISVHIYRPAWIGGHSRTGMCALENQHLFLLIKSCIQMGYAPDWNMELNIVPVDFISKFVVQVSTKVDIKEQVFNLVNAKPLQWLDLINWINNYGYKISIIPKMEWQRDHLCKITKNNALYPLVPLYISRETSQHTQRQIQGLKIKSTHTIDTSKILGLSCPEIDDNMLKCYFQFLRQTNFIHPPQTLGWYKNLAIAASA